MVVFIVALMLALSVTLAVVGIHCNNTAPSGHWAKQDIRALLLNSICGFATRTLAQHNWAKDDVRSVVLTKISGFATRTAPSGFWAKRNLGQVLLNVVCGLAIRTTGTTTARTAATLVATSGTSWCARDRQLGRWLVRNERTCRPATGSHRVVMARWARRRRFKPMAKVEVGFCAWSAEASVPNRRVRRLRAGVRDLFLSKLAEKRAEEKEELEAVEAALAAEAARAEGRALARAAAKSEVRTAWLAARAARRTEAGRMGKLGAVIGGEVTLAVQSWQKSAPATKVAMGKRLRRRSGGAGLSKGQSWLRWATRTAMSSPDIALQLEAELRRSARLEQQYGVELVGEDARGFQAHRVAVAKRQRNAEKVARLAAHQQREATRAAERQAKDWIKWQRDAVRMGLASPIVTKRPGMGQGIAAQAVVLPVLAEYLGFGLGMAIIGMLAAVAIPAFLKFIKKSKTNEHCECPELLAQWEATEEAAEVAAEMLRQDRNQLLIETELMARFEEAEGPTNEQVARWEAEHEEDRLKHEAEQRELFEESDLAFRLGEHNACARYEEAPTDDELTWRKTKFDQWMHECQAEEQAAAETAHLALGVGQSSLALILPVLASFMDLGLGFVVAAVVFGLSDQVKTELKKVIASRNLAQIRKAVFEVPELEGRFSREPLATDFLKDLISRGPDGAVTYINRFVCTKQEAKARAEAQAAEQELAAQAEVEAEAVQEAPVTEEPNQIEVRDEVKAIIGKICDLARNKPVYSNDGPQAGPCPRPPSSRDNENWEADSRAYNEAYTAWLAQEAAGAEHFRNWQDQVRGSHKKQIEDAIFSIPEIQLLDPRDVILMCQTIDSNCNLEEKLEAFTSWVIKSVELGQEIILTNRTHWQEYVQLCSKVGEKPDARYQEYKILYGRSYTTTVALADEIKKFKAELLNRETEKATEVAKAPEVAEPVTLVIPEPAKPEKANSSAKVDLKAANLSGLFGGAIRSNKANAFALPALAPVMGLDVDPLLVVAMVAMAWLISKVSPSFGGFALTLLAGATGYVGATVTGQEADSLQEEEQQGNQPHTDQEGLMTEVKVEVANDRATELLETTKADLIGSLRTNKRAWLYAKLAKAAATSMVKVLLGEGVSLEKTSEAMFEWPGLKPEYRKAAYKAHVDSMQPDGAKACQRELKLKEHYGVSLFEGNGTLEDYKHSLHHIHRTPGSAATIEMYDIIERALKSLAENSDLQAVTIGELAKAWVTLNLIQTNFASEVIALEPMRESQTYLMLNALSKTSFNTIRVKHMAELEKQIKGKGGDGVTGCPTDIFLLYRNAGVLIADGKYNGFDMGSMAYRVRKFTSASKAAKAQKYISQYFAPNLLGGQVVDFAREYTLGKYTFTLKSVSESVLVVKPVSGKSVFEKETAKELADNIYDGVVFVSRRFMALVLPGHVDEIAAGKLDGKVLIGRAYGFNFLIKGGFVIMPPDFIKCTGKDMIAYGSKDEICPTWSENRLTVIINSGVPKSDKGACTDTQTLINGFDLKDKHVQRIFTQIKDDAVEHLRQRLDDVRKGKIQMAELESDILDVMDMDDDEKASDEVLSQLRDSSRLKEIIGAVGYAAGSGMALPQLIAPTMNQMTNQAMDPGRTRLPFSMNMVNAKGEVEYCKIAYSIYPQVHPGLMMQKIAEATGLKLSKGNLALLNGYKNPMTPEQLKELKEEHLECHGLSYDENRNIYCNPADYKKHVERHGTCLVSLFRNPSTFTSGAWGQLVPMECVPVGCYWVNPTPEAFQWFFANQDGADLDDRMIMVMGELAISCILYHEGKKKQLIAKMLAPFKNRENAKTKAAREFIRLQTKFMLKEDMNVSMDADVKLNSEHISMVQDLTGDASTRVLQDMVSDRPLEIGLYSFKETAKQMQKAKYAFSKDTEVDHGSALANVASTIGSLELMKGTTGTAANVQMLMGAITQGLVDFGDGIDLDRKVRIISTSGYDELSESLTSEEFAELDNLTYRDLTFLIKSEMLSNVIDADTQGQNVPEAAEVMEMIWGVSMYLGIALFSGGKSAVQQGKNGTYVTINMISPDKMKFYFPGWLMKRGIGAFAAPFAGQSHMLQHGESSQGKKVNVRHFAFEETKFETANSWVFDIFEDYMDQVLGLAHDQIMATFNEGEAPAWQALELGLQSFSNEVAKARKACNELNELRRAGIMAVHRMGLEPKRRRVALTAVEQGWLAKWHAALPTEEGKLTFALWTLTQLVAAANEKRNDLAFTDRESFVSTSRRSYGSITVKGLPTHTLYVGNLLDADGEAVTCERGLPQGPWLYVLKALNAMAVTPVTAKVDVFFNFTEEYKELKNWIMGMVNCKPGFALETKPCPEVKALMTTKDKFGVHNLDAEVYDNLHSGVVGKTLAEVLQSGLLTVGEDKFIGKLNISKNGSTLINKSYSSWRDGSDDKHQDVKVFIEANNLHDYIVTGIEVVLETKATAKQYAYPSFSLTLKYNGPKRPLQEINLSAYTETLKSKDSEQVDYTSGPIGYHTDVDFDNYDFDDLEDVAVEDFTYSEVIEAEVVEVKAEVKAEPEVELPIYRHPFTDPDPNLILASKYHDEEEEEGFSTWIETLTFKADVGDYRIFDKSAMLVIESPNSLRQLLKFHTEYCLDVKSLQTREDFIEDLKSDAEFFLYLKEKGYTGLYIEVGYFEKQEDMDEAFMEHFLHHFSEPLLFWFYGDEDGSGCHSYRYQLSLDFSTGSDPEPDPTKVEVELEMPVEVTVYQGRDSSSDGREFQYWTENKEEAGDYGQVVVSRTIDLTGMLIQKSNDGKVVFREFCRLHKLKTGENFNLLSPGENSNLFFARLKAAGYTGISFLGSEENRYIVTFDGDGLV